MRWNRKYTVDVVAMKAMQMQRMRLFMRVRECDAHEITLGHAEDGPRECGAGVRVTVG